MADIADDILSPELFTDGAWSYVIAAGVVRIVFISKRPEQTPAGPGNLINVVVGRVVIPIPAALDLVRSLGDFLESNGHRTSDYAPVEPPPKSSV